MSKAKGGLLDKAPGNISDELTLCLGVFESVTRPVLARSSKRSKTRKTQKAGLTFRVAQLQGSWQDMHDDLINLTRGDCRRLLPWDTDRFRPMDVATLYWECLAAVVLELAVRELPELFTPPYSFIGMLNEDPDIALEHRNTLADQWVLVQKVEAMAARGNADASALIDAIACFKINFVRLGYWAIVRDRCRNPLAVGPDSLDVARSCGGRFFDEKGQEYLHGFLRDLGRSKRSKGVGASTCFAAMRDSGVLEARGVTHPRVDASEVAGDAWSCHKTSEFGFPNKPSH